MRFLSKYFINGLIVLVPIAITLWVVLQIFSFSETILGRHLPVHFPGIGLFSSLGFIILVGWMSSHWMMKKTIALGERLLNTIPFIKFIYNVVKKFSTAMFHSKESLNKAVLVPFPHSGSKALGFIMADLSPALASQLPEEHVCVFVPMSLNITSGFNIIVPKREIIPLDVSSESALEYVITAGAIMPDNITVTKK